MVFSDSFTMINPVGTSRERGVCGSTCKPGGHDLSMGVAVGGGGVGPESALAVTANLGQSEAGRAKERVADLIAPALSLFSQSVTTLGLGEALNQEIRPIPPVTAHVRAHTQTCTYAHSPRGEETWLRQP